MKSFKKIAVGVVAAMSIATIVATPASAATTTLTVGGSSVSTGLTAANPVVLPVPADNSVDSADALKIALTGLDTGTVVSAVATNASIVPALATVSTPVTASAGTASLSINTGTGTTADFYVFTKTINAGTVIVTIGGNTTTYYVKGSTGAAYNLSVVSPDTANISTVNKVYVKTTDTFGNPVVTSTPVVTVIGATVGSVSVSDTTTGTFVFDLTAPATTGNAAVNAATKFIAITNIADTVASLTAQLAAQLHLLQ